MSTVDFLYLVALINNFHYRFEWEKNTNAFTLKDNGVIDLSGVIHISSTSLTNSVARICSVCLLVKHMFLMSTTECARHWRIEKNVNNQ